MTKISRPLIHLSSLREGYVSLVGDMQLLARVEVCEWTDTMAEKWAQDWRTVYSTCMTRNSKMLRTKTTPMNYPNFTYHRAREVFCQTTWFTITLRRQTPLRKMRPIQSSKTDLT